ncbi:MAG: MBL fold metallo-hydrolase, partial [Dehalococcoidia bacterium]|nr:MBL fold metallo-hydrolase [Dehalococcoidia bacterium]
MVFESQDRQTREDAAFFYRGDSETIAEGVVFFPSFGTSTAFVCDDRILVVDTAAAQFAGRVVEDLRSNHSRAPVETIVYTHGHIDHTTGARAFLADAEARGHPRP